MRIADRRKTSTFRLLVQVTGFLDKSGIGRKYHMLIGGMSGKIAKGIVVGIGHAVLKGTSDDATFICVEVYVSGFVECSRARRYSVLCRAFTTS